MQAFIEIILQFFLSVCVKSRKHNKIRRNFESFRVTPGQNPECQNMCANKEIIFPFPDWSEIYAEK